MLVLAVGRRRQARRALRAAQARGVRAPRHAGEGEVRHARRRGGRGGRTRGRRRKSGQGREGGAFRSGRGGTTAEAGTKAARRVQPRHLGCDVRACRRGSNRSAIRMGDENEFEVVKNTASNTSVEPRRPFGSAGYESSATGVGFRRRRRQRHVTNGNRPKTRLGSSELTRTFGGPGAIDSPRAGVTPRRH